MGRPGFRRGRRDPQEVRVGDALDLWRVEIVEPGCLLRLRAKMQAPGEAWLQSERLNTHPVYMLDRFKGEVGC